HMGQTVLGAWGWVPELGVGVIVEMDAREAFWPISAMRERLWWLLLIIGIGVTVVAIFIGRKLSEPIISLTSTTQKIARGELTERAGVQSPNELGELAQCINTMAETLQEKNIQLAKLNEELRLLKRG
ncbi:MAG: HAMP domain-containing protein, partial [Candidatus Brocadiales bacterium]